MNILAVDTAGKTAGVALLQDGRLLYEVYLDGGLTHSETLLPLIDTCLKLCGLTCADIDLFGVNAGPGSFTGLRIGLAAVRGLASPRHTPCAPVSTLEALAAGHVGHPDQGKVLRLLRLPPEPQRIPPGRDGHLLPKGILHIHIAAEAAAAPVHGDAGTHIKQPPFACSMGPLSYCNTSGGPWPAKQKPRGRSSGAKRKYIDRKNQRLENWGARRAALRPYFNRLSDDFP